MQTLIVRPFIYSFIFVYKSFILIHQLAVRFYSVTVTMWNSGTNELNSFHFDDNIINIFGVLPLSIF